MKIPLHPIREGKLNVCAAWGVFFNRIVGYAIGSNTKTASVSCEVRLVNAVRLPGNVAGCIVHCHSGQPVSGSSWLSVGGGVEAFGD